MSVCTIVFSFLRTVRVDISEFRTHARLKFTHTRARNTHAHTHTHRIETHTRTHHTHAYAHAKQTGDYAKAEELLKRAVKRSPSDVSILHNYGCLLWEGRKDFKGAEQMLRQAVKLDPTHQPSVQALMELREERTVAEREAARHALALLAELEGDERHVGAGEGDSAPGSAAKKSRRRKKSRGLGVPDADAVHAQAHAVEDDHERAVAGVRELDEETWQDFLDVEETESGVPRGRCLEKTVHQQAMDHHSDLNALNTLQPAMALQPAAVSLHGGETRGEILDLAYHQRGPAIYREAHKTPAGGCGPDAGGGGASAAACNARARCNAHATCVVYGPARHRHNHSDDTNSLQQRQSTTAVNAHAVAHSCGDTSFVDTYTSGQGWKSLPSLAVALSSQKPPHSPAAMRAFLTTRHVLQEREEVEQHVIDDHGIMHVVRGSSAATRHPSAAASYLTQRAGASSASSGLALQRIAKHCNALQHTATHCTSLHCNALHRTATHCNTPRGCF